MKLRKAICHGYLLISPCQAGRLWAVSSADKDYFAHEHQRSGLRDPALVFGRLEHGGTAHRLHQGFCALSAFRGLGLCAACGPHPTACLLHFGGAAAPVPVYLLQPGTGGGHRFGGGEIVEKERGKYF